jgi:rhamnosyltransferase
VAIVGTRGIPARYGGYETGAEELSTALVRRGFKVWVTCESNGMKIELNRTYRGVRLAYFPIIRAIRSLSETILYDTLSVLWATLVADIIYMQGYSGTLALIFPKLLHKTILVNVDGLESKRRKFNRFLRVPYSALEILNTKIADYLIVDSHEIGAYYRRRFGVDSVYIPYGISEIKPLDPAVLKRYGLKNGEYYLVIARLIPDNNIDLIIEGFKRSNSDKKLIIVGPLDNNAYVKRLLVQRDQKIVFLGGLYESRLQRALRKNCFAYIHGHEQGGTNPSLVEALSCRNIVLAIDVSFNREVAEDSALYFEKDPNDLKEKIRLLDSGLDTRHMVEKAYATYRRKYTPEIATEAFVQFVTDIRSRIESKPPIMAP